MVKLILRYFLLLLFVFPTSVNLFAGTLVSKNDLTYRLRDPGDVITTSTGSTALCPGSSMTLTAGTAIAAGNTFKWFQNASELIGQTTPSITITTIGTYQVYVTSTTTGVTTTYPFIVITAAIPPTPTFTHSPDGQCSSSFIQFTNTTTGTNTSYAWDFGDGGTSNLENPTHTFNAPAGCGTANFAVKLVVTNSDGCSGTVTGFINVLKAPSVALQDVDAFNAFSNCQNSPNAAHPNYTLKVNNVSTDASCISSYNVDWGDGTIQNITGASFPLSHTYTQLGAFNLTIIGTGANGCTGTKTYRVANQTNPAGGLSTPGGTVGCAPLLVPFTITNWQSNSPGTTYVLDFGDGTSQTFTHPLNATLEDQVVNHSYTTTSCPARTFTATLTVINACDNTPYTAGNIQVSVKPAANFTYTPNPVCIGNAVCFTNTTTPGAYGSNCIATTTYAWDFGEPTSGTNNTSSATSPCHTYASPGTYTVTLTSSNPCGPDVITHTVTVNPLPTMTSPTTAATCSGTAFSIPLTSDIPATYSWIATSNTSVSGEPLTTQTGTTLTNTLVNLTTSVQVVTYTVTPKSLSGCAGTAQIVKITVNPAPSTPTVTSLLNYCQGTIASTLNATGSSGNTVYWYTASSGGIGSTTAPTPGTTTLGTVNYYVGQTSNTTSCESPRALIAVVVSAIPSTPIINNAQLNYCQGGTATVLSATTTAGNTLKWYTQPSGGTASTTAPTPNLTNSGSTTYYVSQVSAVGCESSRSSIEVIVNPLPDAPIITTPINYCQGATSVPLTATPDVGNSLKWYTTATGGAGSTTAITPSTATTGSKIYYVSQLTPSGCESSRSALTVVVSAIPAKPTVAAAISYCQNETATALTATALSGNTLNWYNNAALTGGSTTAPVPNTTSVGQTLYYVTQSNGFSCQSPPTTITVTVNPLITNNTIGSDQGICSTTAPNPLTGTATLTGGNNAYQYQWKSSPDGVTFTNISGATSANYAPPALSSTTQYQRIVTSGTCSSTSNTVTITVQGLLSNYNISAAQTICNATAPALLTGQNPTGGDGNYTFQWDSSSNGTTWTAITGAVGNDYQPTTLTATTYYRRHVYSNICSSISNTVNITVNPVATISTVSNQYFCNNSNISVANFSATPATSTTFAWTNDNTNIGLSASGSGNLPTFTSTNNTKAPITATIQVTPTYTANAVSCAGTPISFTIIILPTITIASGTSTNYCAGDAVPAFTPVSDAATFTGSVVSYSWTVTSAIGLTAGSGTQVPAFTAINNGTTDLINTVQVTPLYTYQGHICNGTPISYTITVNPKPTTANAGANDKACDIIYTLKGNTPTVGIGTWTVTAGPSVVFSNANSATSIAPGLQKGTRYQFTWTISNQTCTPSSSTVTVDVLTDLVNTITADVMAICPNQQVNFSTTTLSGGDIPGTLTANYTYVWESSANGTTGWQTISSQTSATLTVNPATTTYYRRKVKSYNQCEVISNPIQITVNATAPAAVAGTAMTLCSVTNTLLQGNDPGTGFVGTWTDSASGSILTFSPDAHAYNATVNGLVPGQTYHLVWSIASPSCGTSTSPLTIIDLPTQTNQIGPLATTICAGQSATLTGIAPTGGTGSYQYKWERSTDQLTWSSISGEIRANLTINPVVSTYFRRNVISGTCNLESSAVQVIVQQALANNTISGAQIVCTGKPILPLSGSTPTGGDGSYFYQWQQSTDQTTWSNIATATGIDYQPPVLIQSTYYRRIVNTILCTGVQSHTSAAILITVNQNAKAEFSASSLNGCIPFNLATVITPVAHNDVNSLYQWYADGVLIGNGSAFPGYTIATDGQSVIIKLITTSKFGCDTNSRTMTFTSNKNVAASFTKDQIKGCGPLIVHFANSSTPLAGATYSWDFGNGQTSVKTQPDPVAFAAHPLNKDTTYIITLRASTSCGTSIYKDSVTVRPKPKAIFTPDKTIGCSPFTVHIGNQSRGLPNQYTFDFGDGSQQSVADNQAVQHTYITTKTDTVTLKLYARNECGIDSSSYQIVIYPNTVQANLVVNGTNQTGCVPYTVRFDNNSTGASTFLYDFADGTTAATSLSPETQVHTFTQAGTYVVKLTATNGCSTASATQTITVLPQPAVSFSVNELQYCANQNAIFTNTTPTPAAFSYVWDFGDGSTSNQVQASHTYATAGKYSVKLTAIQNAPGATCSATVIHDVTILPLPIATFSSNAGNLNCAPFLLTVSSTPANASSVSWNFGDPGSINNTATNYTAQHLFTKAGLYTIKQMAYNQTGCLDSTTQVVRITESPKAAFTTQDTVICGNSASLLFKNGTTYGGNDLVNYKWYVNGTFISTQQDLSYNFSAPAGAILPYTLKVKLLVYSTIGCPDSVSHNILFNPLPVAGFTVGNTISCAPFTVQAVNTSAYADSYRWYVNNVLVSTAKAPTNIILKQASQTYVLKLVTTNIYGCGADSVSRTLSTYPKPTAQFSLTDSTSCNGQLAVTISNTTTGAISYTWNFGDGSPESSALIPTHTYGVPGAYTLRLIAFNGTCRDTASHQIGIANPVKSAFTASALKGCTQLSTTFQNLAVNASTYLWDFGDGTFSTAKNPTHVFTYTGSPFTIKMTAYGEYGCNDQSVQLNYITVTAPPIVDFAAIPDSVINIPNHTLDFKNLSTGGVVYNWDFGDNQSSTLQTPSHTYADTGTFKVRLTVTNTQGCQSARTRTVKVSGVPQYLYVPNAFEPGSARSELRTFSVRGTGLADYRLRIYNKWGQLLYQTSVLDSKGSPTKGWDGMMNGQPAPQGIYVWDIQARFLDGTLWHGMNYNDGRSVTTSGSITLMR